MPELSRFYGIIIRMYYDDHAPAHFHAFYGEFAKANGNRYILPLTSVNGHGLRPRSWIGFSPIPPLLITQVFLKIKLHSIKCSFFDDFC